MVLGFYVIQKGLLVGVDWLCFDFIYMELMKLEEIWVVECLVNEQICGNSEVSIEFMVIDDVKVCGVMVLFGEKYDDEV